MVNGLKVGRWKLVNAKKGGRRSKGIGSTRDGETRMRGACKMTRAHNGVNWGAGASNARKGQEMAFGEVDGVVGWARGSALGHHLHTGEQRWTLGGRPLKRERDSVLTEMEILVKMYNETLRPILHSGHKQPLLETISSPSPSKQVSRTQVPSFYSCSPAYLTVSKSSTHSSPATNRRANHHRDAFTRLRRTVCYSTIYPAVSKSTYLSCLALRGKLGDWSCALCRGNAEV
jgi:hypothetical protein